MLAHRDDTPPGVMATHLPAPCGDAQRAPLLGTDVDDRSRVGSRSRSLSVVATVVTALIVGAVVAVARGDGMGLVGTGRILSHGFPNLGDQASTAVVGAGVLGKGKETPDGDGAVIDFNHHDEKSPKLRDAECKIGYYYHIPKTGGGSLVRYFGHLPEVELLRYESTIHVPKENKTLYFWEHQSSAEHWEKFIVPQSLKPGKHLIAHHWGRFGMLGMEKRLQRLRARAEELGCEFMSSVTFREPIERDISDDVFKRITGVGSGNYAGDEQLRFLLLNSQRVNSRVPADIRDKPEVKEDVLKTATKILTDDFDLVATIEDLELQKNAFLSFFNVENTFDETSTVSQSVGKQTEGVSESGADVGEGFASAVASAGMPGASRKMDPGSALVKKNGEEREKARRAERAAAAAMATEDSLKLAGALETSTDKPTSAGAPLQHVHMIDYAELGIDDAEMEKLRAKFEKTNTLDSKLYETARRLSRKNHALRVSDGVYRAQQHMAAAAARAAVGAGEVKA